MRVFVTGASGFIGQVVVRELLAAGHQVLGLVRSDKTAELVAGLGAEVHRGSLEDVESLKKGAAASDGVIHLAFIHDFSDYEGGCHADQRAIEAMGSVLAGSNRPLIITSGTLLLPPGRLATEDDFSDPNGAFAIRGRSETLALSLMSEGVRASVVRLAPIVHGDGDPNFVPNLISTARKSGVSAYIGDGLPRWPAVHREDAVHLYLLALEKGSAGAVYHGVAEEGVQIKEIAAIIGEQLDLPVVSKSVEEAAEHFGWISSLLVWDNPTSSKKTREQLGWNPTRLSLISDLKEGPYFKKTG